MKKFLRVMPIAAVLVASGLVFTSSASAAVTVKEVLGRNAVRYTSYPFDPTPTASWVASAQGESVDTNGNNIADSLRGRGAVLEDFGVKRARIYRVQLQRNEGTGDAPLWINASVNETDVVSDAARAFAVSYTPAVRYCGTDPSLLRDYRVVNVHAVRRVDDIVAYRTTVSHIFTTRMLASDPLCPESPPAPTAANLAVNLTVSPTAVSGTTSQTLTYTVKVSNASGAATAQSTYVDIPIPSETNVGTLPANCSLFSPTVIRCTFGTVMAGDEEFATFTLTTVPADFSDTTIHAVATVNASNDSTASSDAADVSVDCRFSTATLTNRPDSGEDGNTWAFDTFTRTTRICEGPTGTYVVTVSDSGTFNPVSGEKTPRGTDINAVIADDAPNGTIVGGFTTTIDAADNFATYSDADMTGTFTGTAPASSGTWAAHFFTDVADTFETTLTDWKWTYKTCSETYVQSDDGYSGNITGKPCSA